MLQGEHSAILSTFIKLPYVFHTFVLSIFKWPLKTGFTVRDKFDNIVYLYQLYVQDHAMAKRCSSDNHYKELKTDWKVA